MQMQLKLLTETLQGKSKNMKTYNINKNKKKGFGDFHNLRSRQNFPHDFFGEKISDFHENPSESFSRQGRRLCPINVAKRNVLF